MKNNPVFLLAILLSMATLWSCSDKQDFDQFDDLQLTPTAEASLVYVASTEDFINQSAPGVYYTEDFNFDAFAEAFVSERVLDGLVTYEVENTTSKELEITVEFLDEAGNVLDTETFLIDPAPTGVVRREIAYGGASGRSIEILRNTSGIRVSGRNLGDATSVSNLPDPKIILRSSAQIRIELV